MFTGIITDIGRIAAIEPRGEVLRLSVISRYPAARIDLGASIACDGVCLTIVAAEPRGEGSLFSVEIGPETLSLTTAKSWRAGGMLNLERALKMGDELGGHLVLGHVDGVATIASRENFGDTVRFTFDAPETLARFIAVKGSICLDGTSLTVNAVEGARFSVHLIPHTLSETGWSERNAGDGVNLEVDMMARYAARLAEASGVRY